MGSAITRILADEKQFYESETKDRLKVPPYNMVRRIPRDYTAEQNRQPSANPTYKSLGGEDDESNE